MQLYLEGDTLVKDVQLKFNFFYPYLQLQFFRNSEGQNKPGQKLQIANPHLPIDKFAQFYMPVNISISNKTTVSDLIKNFKKVGLIVQVCRKSGNLWVETCLTDDWTLERQNNEAFLLTIPHKRSFSEKRG